MQKRPFALHLLRPLFCTFDQIPEQPIHFPLSNPFCCWLLVPEGLPPGAGISAGRASPDPQGGGAHPNPTFLLKLAPILGQKYWVGAVFPAEAAQLKPLTAILSLKATGCYK